MDIVGLGGSVREKDPTFEIKNMECLDTIKKPLEQGQVLNVH